MDSQRALKQLEAQQARIATLLNAVAELLTGERANAGQTLAALRWQLIRTLREYQLFKHREIFDPLAASSCVPQADLARGMKKRCIAMGQAYAVHVQRWSSGMSMTQGNYAPEAHDIVARIRAHLERERAEAHSLLAGIRRTRQGTSSNNTTPGHADQHR